MLFDLQYKGVPLSKHYKLNCDCGKFVIVTEQQAGQVVFCSCGTELSVPSMMQIRQLEKVEKQDIPDSFKEKKVKTFRFTENRIVTLLGWILFIPSCIFLIYLLFNQPVPADTAWMQRRYTAGGRDVWRDSYPLSPRDVDLLIGINQQGKYVAMSPEFFEYTDPYHLWYYYNHLKLGPELSENFYEKFERLQLLHQIKLGVAGIGVFVSCVLLILGYFLKKSSIHKKTD